MEDNLQYGKAQALADMPIGTHFWGLDNGRLAVFMKYDADTYYICGGWECPVREDEITLVQIIPIPEGHKDTDLYYLA